MTDFFNYDGYDDPKEEKEYEQYDHHGNKVWVRSDLKGKHWDYCLCASCTRLNIKNHTENCVIANMLYSICVEQDLVIPVWECAEFTKRRVDNDNDS